MRRIATCLTALALLWGGVGQAKADIILTFQDPGFEWHHPSGGATPNHIWVTGDYWAQTFPGTGQDTAGEMILNLNIDDNNLASGAHVDLLAQLNGVTVGSFSVPSGVSGLQTYDFTFAPVAGPDYRIQLLETNTVPFGDGSVSMASDGTSTATLRGVAPEPSSLTLFGLGTLGLLGSGWRRRERTVP
jgi:hypothetical protein